MKEFHVSRSSRDRYQFDASLFSNDGSVVLADFRASRLFAQHINQKRDLIHSPEQAVRAGQINAMGLIDEFLHLIIDQYCQKVNPQLFKQALSWLEEKLGRDAIDQALRLFIEDFPPMSVYRKQLDAEAYLSGRSGETPNREILLEELLLLWLENDNPAMAAYAELFDDKRLREHSIYLHLIANLSEYLSHQPSFGPQNQSLIEILRSPVTAYPYSLSDQLRFIYTLISTISPDSHFRFLSGVDLIREEEKPTFGGGPGPNEVPNYAREAVEIEKFTFDQDWMPGVILLAKNTYVWLDQLSKKYQREIIHLDQIPDEELDALAAWGFNGLWLIGIWERSEASKRIKQLCGASDIVASAYSLREYQIAADLGGDAAFQNLRDRAWQRRIRLASDMVPNHMGIDSPWVVDHPDWFLSTDHCPFPSYTFTGPDLSSDPRIGIFLEDHYYSKTDAAVVFKRVDYRNGDIRYVYHGNDGTNMPWNDTAQLNYLNPEVREVVIQTILQVARKFPIIRFDAAMVLAKKHIQRLWYPEPGSGGAIPSRSEFSLSKEAFDAMIPNEFWREVVDRATQEVPDTLLLAEAFWMMEGYFVRTLGLHRVYNSAFMNMLRDEDNAHYHTVLKNTLEFDPDVLKRFVNFMNNPDERTAVDQFGKEGKYFGVCTMMVTLPGLPMFGHGQIEGFTEKYGMEFRKARWNEQVDYDLVQQHVERIFTLLKYRPLFVDADQFLLYDFFTGEGTVDENVFAYSNGKGQEHALVFYHNRYASTRGWIKVSAPTLVKDKLTGEKKLVQNTLAQGLGLLSHKDAFVIYKNPINHLEYIARNTEFIEKGFYIELGAYQTCVFVEFRQVHEDEFHPYSRLAEFLKGSGVPSIELALQDLPLTPIQPLLHQLVTPEVLNLLSNTWGKEIPDFKSTVLKKQLEPKIYNLMQGVKAFTRGQGDVTQLTHEIMEELVLLHDLSCRKPWLTIPGTKKYSQALEHLDQPPAQAYALWESLYVWAIVHILGKIVSDEKSGEISRAWLNEWALNQTIHKTLLKFAPQKDAGELWHIVNRIQMLTSEQNWFAEIQHLSTRQMIEKALGHSDVRQFLGINRFEGTLWFNQEAFDEFVWCMLFLAARPGVTAPNSSAAENFELLITCDELLETLHQAEQNSQFRVEKLLEQLE